MASQSSASECAYVVRDDAPLETIARSLAALLPTRHHAIGRHRFSVLDTVDGLVRRAGAGLTRAGINGHSTIVWHRPRAAGHLTAAVSEPVSFAWDLPAGPLRQVVADAVGPRRLLEHADAEEYGSLLDVLDDQGKIVARVRIVSGRARLPHGRWHDLPTVITLTGLRGYEGIYAQLVPVIESRPDVERCPGGLQAVLLQQIGAASWPVVSPHVDLPAAVEADVGARRIHNALLSTLVANEPGVRNRLDTEFLHDFRVAVRRTRSLLGQIRGVFPPAGVEHFATEFSWLGRLTGPPRDMDVLVVSIRAEQSDRSPDAEPLLAFLGDLQQQEYRALVEALDGDRYARLLSDWRMFLDSPVEPHADAPNTVRPLVDVVSRRAWRLSRRIMASADTTDESTDAARLHEVRIDAKKLRYLIDVTPGFYESAALERVLSTLKHLQRVLGDFNDAHVQADRLLTLRRASRSAGLSPAIGRALARLAEERRRRGASLRAHVLAALTRFGAGGMRSACRRAFHRGAVEERAQ